MKLHTLVLSTPRAWRTDVVILPANCFVLHRVGEGEGETETGRDSDKKLDCCLFCRL